MLPHDTEAEMGLLGSILLKPDEVLATACAAIRPEHFYVPAHVAIYGAILDMWRSSSPIDMVLLTSELRDRGILDEVGGPAFVAELFTFIPTAALADQYAAVLVEKFTLRKLIAICSEYRGRCLEAQDDPKGLLDGMASEIAAVSVDGQKERKSFRELLEEKLERMERNEADPDTIPTGIAPLDKNSPLRLGAMPVIAAERKAGKSILALNIAKNVAEVSGPVAYFSLEDPAEEIVDRLFQNESRIPQSRQFVGKGGLTEGDFSRATTAAAKLSRMDFTIIDDVYDILGIIASTRKLKAQKPSLKAIIVDYIQLVRGDQKKGTNREQEIAGVSRCLRLLSMELHIAVIALSQLNKDGGTRESQAIEQDCTALWKLQRVYKEPKNKNEEPEEETGKRLIVVPFQRKGMSGIAFPVAFIGALARFAEIAEEPNA